MADGEDERTTVSSLRSRSPGETPHDPYGDVDVSELPAWWQAAIREYEAFGLRPYQPPRFEDGTLKHTVVSALEDELDVSIVLLGWNVEYEDDWSVYVDGEPIGDIGRRRSPDGYTVFEMTADEFVEFVRATVADR